jgi:hypothetical protein
LIKTLLKGARRNFHSPVALVRKTRTQRLDCSYIDLLSDTKLGFKRLILLLLAIPQRRSQVSRLLGFSLLKTAVKSRIIYLLKLKTMVLSRRQVQA